MCAFVFCILFYAYICIYIQSIQKVYHQIFACFDCKLIIDRMYAKTFKVLLEFHIANHLHMLWNQWDYRFLCKMYISLLQLTQRACIIYIFCLIELIKKSSGKSENEEKRKMREWRKKQTNTIYGVYNIGYIDSHKWITNRW